MYHKSRVQLQQFDPCVGRVNPASKLRMVMWYTIKVTFFLSAFPFSTKFKCRLLRMFGAVVGTGVVIKPRVNIHFPWNLVIGDHVWIGEEVFILNFEQIVIGSNVCISQRAFLCGGNHDYKSMSMTYRNGPIELKDGCWIGASCFVGPNVTVGSDTVVCAASVVTKSLNNNKIYTGNPAIIVKDRWHE